MLIRTAEVLRGGRSADAAFRLGGDEFAVIMPETDEASANLAAGRIAELIG